jgi:RES domain-containing protein
VKLYRIVQAKYANGLYASGIQGRWNATGELVIYASESRALACLENLVYRNGYGLQSLYRILVLELSDDVVQEEIRAEHMPEGWNDPMSLICRKIGSKWIRENRSCVLRVPSVIVPQEYNFVINMRYSEFPQLKLTEIEVFQFDRRFS